MEYNGFKISNDGTYGYKFITRIGTGALPAELKGSFTNSDMAKRAIDIALARKDVKNGEVLSSVRG